MQSRSIRRPLLGLILLALIASACGGTRPDAGEWVVVWDQTVALIPEASTLEATPPKEQCETVLASLRESKEEVIPTPDEALDAIVNEWLMIAEGAFFECPPVPDGFDGAYTKLAQLEDQVTTFLATG